MLEQRRGPLQFEIPCVAPANCRLLRISARRDRGIGTNRRFWRFWDGMAGKREETAVHRDARVMDRQLLEVRVMGNTRDEGHLRLAFLHDRCVFLGSELASICANQYAILEVIWHTLLLSTSGRLMVTLEARWILQDFALWMRFPK